MQHINWDDKYERWLSLENMQFFICHLSFTSVLKKKKKKKRWEKFVNLHKNDNYWILKIIKFWIFSRLFFSAFKIIKKNIHKKLCCDLLLEQHNNGI